jgi:predicted metallo-beta-lactamase superfamily hydrolase
VHASDIQLLDDATIDCILDWQPDWVVASGPPLYHPGLDARQRARAWFNARCLAAEVSTLILDHHVMRSLEGEAWLEKLALETGRRVYCAADFMGRPRRLLEARRRELYAAMPVRPGWHAEYAQGRARVEDFAPVEAWRRALK